MEVPRTSIPRGAMRCIACWPPTDGLSRWLRDVPHPLAYCAAAMTPARAIATMMRAESLNGVIVQMLHG